MGIGKYFGLERRRIPRQPASVDVTFYVWDGVAGERRTQEHPGLLTDISFQGACLQANRMIIDGHHLLLDEDVEGHTPIVLVLPADTDDTPCSLYARVLWYNRISAPRKYQFDIGVRFQRLTEPQKQRLEKLITPSGPA